MTTVDSNTPNEHPATPNHPLDPTGRTLRLLDSGVQMELGDPKDNDLTYLERTLCQVSLPYRNPGDQVSHWVRRNGNLQLTVRPGIGPDGTPVWAYGVMPRLLLMWISDQVIKKTSAVDGRTVVFNDSLRGFLEDLGIGYTGPNGRKVRQQVWALANTSLTLNVFEAERAAGASMNIADTHELLWSHKDPAHTPALVGTSHITISERFYQSIAAHPVPLETQVIQALRTRGGGGLPLDIFSWLKYRLFSAHRRQERFPLRMTWESLAHQFGAQYKHTRQFKAKFIPQLTAVQVAWPMFRFDAQEKILLLWATDTYRQQLNR